MSQHRWEQWTDSKEVVKVLWNAKERLKTAWARDQESPSYPTNTSYVLAEIRESLPGQLRDRDSTPPNPKKVVAPKSIDELIPERVVKVAWEEHHTGAFRDALRLASVTSYKDIEKSWKAFQSIIRAMELAYLARFFGEEALPKPKISILHSGLDQIAKAAGLGEQSGEGFAEFLDDLCPCGLIQHKDAVRKLWSRSPRIRRRSSRGIGPPRAQS